MSETQPDTITRNAYNAKTGSRIKGSQETTPGCALISDDSWTKAPDGTIGFDYDGETEMYWDGQTTDTGPNRERLFVDDDGETVPESELVLLTDDEWDLAFAGTTPREKS